MLRDFFLGMVKIHILYHASKEEVYGVALMEELGRHEIGRASCRERV